MLNGTPLNRNLGTYEPEIVANLLGKNFKAERKVSFNLPYLESGNYSSKQEALEAVTTYDYFKIETE